MKKLGPVSWLTALRRTDLVAKELKVLRRGMVVAVCVRFCHRGRPGSIAWNSLWDLWWTEWLTMGQVFLRVLRFSRQLYFHQCFSFVFITIHNLYV